MQSAPATERLPQRPDGAHGSGIFHSLANRFRYYASRRRALSTERYCLPITPSGRWCPLHTAPTGIRGVGSQAPRLLLAGAWQAPACLTNVVINQACTFTPQGGALRTGTRIRTPTSDFGDRHASRYIMPIYFVVFSDALVPDYTHSAYFGKGHTGIYVFPSFLHHGELRSLI